MNVKIEEIKVLNKNTFVNFASPLGRGKAIWLGNMPIKNENYDVEIDIDEKLWWGSTILGANSKQPKIKEGKDSIELTGEVVAIEEDGLLIVSIGGSLIFVETDLEKNPQKPFVTMRTHHLTMHESNY
ncbi:MULTISPECIES: hypothetical protein [Halomonas]|uniref:hypothetical protein n=1 Tax=Halomonas TaxID=2745 RepID=UPI0011B27DE3|nr:MULTISPECIES: hypothetical protein [Halomonas]